MLELPCQDVNTDWRMVLVRLVSVAAGDLYRVQLPAEEASAVLRIWPPKLREELVVAGVAADDMGDSFLS